MLTKPTSQNSLRATDYFFEGQTAFYRGKVRDVYTIKNQLLVMVASDRISAFDVVLPKGIPFKGQVLNQTASYFLEATRDIVPNWLLGTPDSNVAVGKMCNPFKVEMVIRGYLAGHAAREYALGKRMVCGVALHDGLKENDFFPEPETANPFQGAFCGGALVKDCAPVDTTQAWIARLLRFLKTSTVMTSVSSALLRKQ